MSDECDMPPTARARWIKIGAASLAFIPILMLVLAGVLYHAGIVSESVAKSAYLGCCIFNFPAAALWVLIDTFHFSPMVRYLCGVVLVLSWSSLMAWLFWNFAARLLGEGQAPDQRGKFNWIGFQVRFFSVSSLDFFWDGAYSKTRRQ